VDLAADMLKFIFKYTPIFFYIHLLIWAF